MVKWLPSSVGYFCSRKLSTDLARASDSVTFFTLVPVLSVWPPISRFSVGYCSRIAATSSSTGKLSGLMLALLTSKLMSCRRIMPVSSSWVSFSLTSIGQPLTSTLSPAGVAGHWSMPSATPSPSESTGQPLASTTAPFGVFSHWSRPSKTPSPSESMGQPTASTLAPFGVSGQVSMPSATPSPSASVGQPFLSTLAPFGVPSHLSRPSNTPSPSESIGQPVAFTLAPIGVFGHWSSQLRTPSRSWSFDLPRNVNCSAAVATMWFENSVALALCSMTSRTWSRRCVRSRPMRLMTTPAPIEGAPLRLIRFCAGSCARP